MAKIVLTKNKYRKEIPLGLMVLKSYLDQTPHKSWIFDLSLDRNSINSLEDLIIREQADFLGVSVGSITYRDDLELIKKLKSITRIKVVIGGAFANTPKVFDKFVDHIIFGRGEEKLLKLLDEFDGIKSQNPTHKLNTDLVKFEDYQFPKNYNGNREFPLYTSTGCKFRCVYCSIPSINEYRVWFKDPSIVCEEIEELFSKKITYLRFVDDLFGFDRLKTNQLLSQISNMQRLQGIYTQLRLDCADKELLEKMRGASFLGIYFGIESANEETLKRIGKPYTQRKVKEILRLAKEFEFDITGAFTIGYPWETREEIKQTLSFANEMRQEFNLRPSIYIVTPFAGTLLSKKVKEDMIRTRDYTIWDAKHAVMDTAHLKREEIQELYEGFKIS
jgi:radical SAM superfamily enzyme YgiQ (UPF0313 family)